jgi:arylsulfatase A-like enzyme
MRAVGLLAVLVSAKALVLAAHPTAPSLWAPFAYFWQDLLVAVIAGVADVLLRRPRAGWALYAAAVAYIALNVPVAAATGSPLTPPMIRAAGGTLADSIAYYMTWENLARMGAVVAIGAVAPLALTRYVGRFVRPGPPGGPHGWPYGRTLAGAAGLVIIALGPVAASRVDTRGLDRNAVTALLPIAAPAAAAAPSHGRDWRTSPFPGAADGAELERFRGSARGMDVLVVVLESVAARYLRSYGAASDPMPNLSALFERALVFENAYASYPESIKGLLGVLCSQHPTFAEPVAAQAARPCDSVAAALKRDGYRTALFHSGRFGYLGMEAVITDRGFDLLEDAGTIGGNVQSSFGVDEPATVDRILAWVDSLEPGERFFATYLPVAGHHPYAVPAAGPFPNATEHDRYLNALHYADAALGALLDGLRIRGRADRTTVIVFGDHGEAFGQHPGNVGHTFFVHDENVRVPYGIAIPGITTASVRTRAVASLVDTAPTILDLLALPALPRHQGVSLLEPGARMALFLTDYSLGWLGLRDGCWSYQFETGARRSQLYDVCRDADERHDLAGLVPQRTDAYQAIVEGWAARRE